jgi:hypothetical protein
MKHFIYFLITVLQISCMTRNKIFQPVVKEGDNLLYSEISKMPQGFTEKIIKVFDYYSVKYKIDNHNSNILIASNLYVDKDLLWNYTSKANDSIWYESHILHTEK